MLLPMKSYLSVLIFLLLCGRVSGQAALRPARLSALTRLFMSEWSRGFRPGPGVIHPFVFQRSSGGDLRVRGFLRSRPELSERSLEEIGLATGTRAGSVRTFSLPPHQLAALCRLPGVDAIDLDQAGFADLDSARKRTRVDSVHAGFGLPRRFSGDSTVMGIIDAGFDYSHPVLYDTAYQAYRVKRVWEQKSQAGSPPSGFPYGSEFSDSAAILAKAYDVTETTHGTHVAGIAGGGGYNGDGLPRDRYRGFAYGSDLVLVAIYPSPEYWLNTGMTDFLDGMRYIFSYGQSVGRPAVANLSWGCPLGPRDGSSLFSQACDSITGPGKIFVVSGGNNGNNKIHCKKAFSPADSLLHTFTTFSASLPDKRNQIDVWGEPGQNFELQVTLYNGSVKVAAGSWIPLGDSTYRFQLVGTNFDTLFVTATAVASEFNGKPHMLLQLFSRVNDRVGISVKAYGGMVHLWQGLVFKTSGYYGIFTRHNYAWATDGDVAYTCGDLVSTRSALAVAAYNTKVSFQNVSGQSLSYTGYVRGRLAAFSSQGPTADGRVKPDVAAPGMALASGVSSYDPDYEPGGADYDGVVRRFTSARNGRTYGFGMAGGTSMAAPCASGICAFLLQENPQLNPAGLLALFRQSAIRDVHTGAIPAAGSTSWGFGKINAMGALRTLLDPAEVQPAASNGLAFTLYPNPGTGVYRLARNPLGSEPVRMRVFRADGSCVRDEIRFRNPDDTVLDLRDQKPGILVVRLDSGSGQAVFRLVQLPAGW